MGLRATATFKARDTSSLLNKIAAGAANGVLEVATQGQALSKLYAPRDTGLMADTIEVASELNETSAEARFGPTVPYAPYPEFGTGQRGAASAEAGPGPYDPNWPGMAPIPFMRPSYDELKSTALDTVAAAVRSEL